jgi:enediyne biosynthesis protein E3
MKVTQDIISETRRLRGVPPLPSEVAQRLSKIHSAYSQGYQVATTTDELEAILSKLNTLPADLIGFALEGVGTGLAQRDVLAPTEQNRVEAFVKGSGAAYKNFVYVGLGLMLGRKKLPIEPYLKSLSLTKSWLVLDGYGFQHGFTHWQDYLQGQPIPEALSGYACEVFDQGMGRSIWFIDGTDVTRIPQTIAAFSTERQLNLWGGVGYACAYAGGVERPTLEALKIAAGSYHPILAQAAALAAKSRQLIGNPAVYTELACEVMCGMGAEAAVETVDKMLDSPLNTIDTPDHESWQSYRIHLLRQSKIALLA